METMPAPPGGLRPALSRAGAAMLDLFFPPRCVACDRAGAHLCSICIAAFRSAIHPRCLRCWAPGLALTCDRCAARPPAFESLRAAFIFTGPLREAIHSLKYRGLSAAAGPLVDRVDLAALPPALDLVAPVPMTGRRRRGRGYNQADLIARELARRLALPRDSRALVRTRNTPQQARQPDLRSRRENVAGTFSSSMT